jgi:antitoxin component of MazEF toxin-antitoxin module
MVSLQTIQRKSGSGVVTLPKDHLELLGLLDEDGDPESTSVVVRMTSLGVWRVELAEDADLTEPVDEISVSSSHSQDKERNRRRLGREGGD